MPGHLGCFYAPDSSINSWRIGRGDGRQKSDMAHLGPLSNILVLDMSRILAGPWATQALADLGAEVVKVERPGEGDDTRRWGPPFETDPKGVAGDAAYFHAANRNKRSIAIDMATAQGQAILRQIASRADVVVENFKVGGLARYGLDWASLSKINPRLIYCSITGFGQDGPYAARAGYDILLQAMGGLMSVTGAPDGAPGGGPQKVGVAICDLFTGMYAALGVVAALHERTKTGRGRRIDLSLLDCQVAMMANQNMNWLVGGRTPTRLGSAHPNIAPYQPFATDDGHVIVAVGNDAQFERFSVACGRRDWLEETAWRTNAGRVEDRDRLIPEIETVMRTRPTEAWIRAFEAANVPCGPVNAIPDVFNDPQVIARGLQITTSDGQRTAPNVASPLARSFDQGDAERTPPRLGADTRAVLSAFGYGNEDIDALAKAGVLGLSEEDG